MSALRNFKTSECQWSENCVKIGSILEGSRNNSEFVIPIEKSCWIFSPGSRRCSTKAWDPTCRGAATLRSTASSSGSRADEASRPGVTKPWRRDGQRPPTVRANAGRAKRQAAADDSAAGPSNDAPAAKRPRGRPPKGVSVEPLAPKPVTTTAARKLRKAADATQPASEIPSTTKAGATKAPRVSRRKQLGKLLLNQHQRHGQRGSKASQCQEEGERRPIKALVPRSS
ncbi:hypothetical protein HPB52_019130 [Rhipicephalus sanguineus]|uniref:Uncharacterized protein n=1 Tax=Rhipicephalus sanguineus TaxID=34632 RepID=A0A9D4QC22_RHISA|nr:hypothetical protein HPB52_019130 [Rhipicephalus sanguineus]